MTTGERLVDISTLTSDTALNHFLNIEVGGAVYNWTFGTGDNYYLDNLKMDLDFIEKNINLEIDKNIFETKIHIFNPMIRFEMQLEEELSLDVEITYDELNIEIDE